MPDRFRVVGRAGFVSVPKYWTGRMLGRFPEYVRDKRRALALSEVAANVAALEFGLVMFSLAWSAEPVEQELIA